MQLYTKIFIGMLIGLLAGLGAQWFGGQGDVNQEYVKTFITQVADPIGALFIQLIKFVVVPLVFSSLLISIAGLGDLRQLGRLGGRTLGIFALTATAAVAIALVAGNLMHPGVGIPEAARQALLETRGDPPAGLSDNKPFAQYLVELIPANPLKAAVETQMLQIIFAAMLFGVAIAMMKREDAEPLMRVFHGLNEATLVIVGIAMKLSPIAVTALIFSVVAKLGVDIFFALLYYALTVILALAVLGLFVYAPLVKWLGGMSPWRFFAGILPVFQIAFGTSSSSATLPASMKYGEERLGIPRPILGFVLPMGTTVNMDGTAIYQIIAGLFIAQLYGIDLTITQQLMLGGMAALAAIGAAGIPGGSIPLMAGVFGAVGIPLEGIAIILGIDRILDMCRTMLNVAGDLVCATCVQRLSEKDADSVGNSTKTIELVDAP